MKAATIIAGVFAACVAAVPVQERNNNNNNNFQNLNNFHNFNNQNFNYIGAVNNIELSLLEELSGQNLDVNVFQSLFQSSSFSLSELLQLQQLQTLLQIQSLGVLSGFDLSTVQFNQLDLGLINGIGSFDANSLISSSLTPQIVAVIETSSFA